MHQKLTRFALHGFDHSKDVVEWRSRLHVVAGTADVSLPVRSERRQAVARLGSHDLRRAKRQHALIVHPAVKDHSAAEFSLQLRHVHAGTGMLDGIQNVHPAVQNRLEQRASRTVGMVEDV